MSNHRTRYSRPIWRDALGLAWGTLALFTALMPAARADDEKSIAELKAMLVETREAMKEMQSAYEARVDALEARIDELEANTDETSAKQAELESTAIEQQTLLEEVRSEVQDRLSIHGYYDFQYIDADSEVLGSFIQNELSIFLRSTTDDERWTIFGELEFERIDGNDYLASRGSESGEIEVETAWLEYRHNDRLRIRAGKLLLPQYWQTYHYPNLTLSSVPPLMVGNVFPKSIDALQLSGDWWIANERGISYTLYGGNGGDANRFGLDRNENKALGGRLTFHLAGKNKPAWLDTLDFSLSAFLGDDDNGLGETILGADAQIRMGRVELLTELAHSNQARRTHTFFHPLHRRDGESLGFYVQPSYRLSPKWHAFYRYDYLDLDDEGWTPYDEARHTLGLNFRPQPNISLKLEFFHGEPEDQEDFNGLASSVVFNF